MSVFDCTYHFDDSGNEGQNIGGDREWSSLWRPELSDNSLCAQKSLDKAYPVESEVKVVKDVVKEIR
jgi:hypothetical protein